MLHQLVNLSKISAVSSLVRILFIILISPIGPICSTARALQPADFITIQKTATLIEQDCPPAECVVVGLGRSPGIFMAQLQNHHDNYAFTLPMSGLQNSSEEIPENDHQLLEHLKLYLPLEKFKNKRVVVLDYVQSGKSLVIGSNYIRHYLTKSGVKRPQVALLGIENRSMGMPLHSEVQRRIVLTDDDPLAASLRFKGTSHISEFGTFKLTNQKDSPHILASERLPTDPIFSEFKSALKTMEESKSSQTFPDSERIRLETGPRPKMIELDKIVNFFRQKAEVHAQDPNKKTNFTSVYDSGNLDATPLILSEIEQNLLPGGIFIKKLNPHARSPRFYPGSKLNPVIKYEMDHVEFQVFAKPKLDGSLPSPTEISAALQKIPHLDLTVPVPGNPIDYRMSPEEFRQYAQAFKFREPGNQFSLQEYLAYTRTTDGNSIPSAVESNCDPIGIDGNELKIQKSASLVSQIASRFGGQVNRKVAHSDLLPTESALDRWLKSLNKSQFLFYQWQKAAQDGTSPEIRRKKANLYQAEKLDYRLVTDDDLNKTRADRDRALSQYRITRQQKKTPPKEVERLNEVYMLKDNWYSRLVGFKNANVKLELGGAIP